MSGRNAVHVDELAAFEPQGFRGREQRGMHAIVHVLLCENWNA